MNIKNPIIKGAFILTAAGLLTRLAGFFYRIFLSRTLGDSGLGLYQLSFTVAGLCYALCCGGISTSISRFVAQAPGDRRRILSVGLLISFLLSIPTSILIYVNAPTISTLILHEPDCTELVQYIAFSIPLASFHGCASGYYLGQKKVALPAVTQLVEQSARILCVYCIWIIQRDRRLSLTPTHAMIGSLIGEIVAALITIIALETEPQRRRLKPAIHRKTIARNMLGMATPLTLNRVILTFLQSTEATLIPFMLCRYGMSRSNAFAVFGSLTGMAFPFILFPQSIIQSISSMLLPEVADAKSNNRSSHLKNTVTMSLSFSLLIGILCTGVFTTYGHLFGAAIFNNERVGYFIIVLSWLCPFLYINNTLTSTLNGLGKSTATFLFSMAGTFIKLVFIVLLIPEFGILAYLWGILTGTITESFLLYFAAKKEIGLTLPVYKTIIRPIYTMFLAIGITYFAEKWILGAFAIPQLASNLICCVLIAGIYSYHILFTSYKS